MRMGRGNASSLLNKRKQLGYRFIEDEKISSICSGICFYGDKIFDSTVTFLMECLEFIKKQIFPLAVIICIFYIIPSLLVANKEVPLKHSLTNLQLAVEKLRPVLNSFFLPHDDSQYFLLKLSKDRIKRKITGQQTIITFLHERKNKNAKRFVMQYANITATHGECEVTEIESRIFGSNKELFRESLRTKLKSNNIVILWNIQDLKSDLPLIIHSEADVDTNSNKNGFWIMTIEVDSFNDTCSLALDKSLKDAWDKKDTMMNIDQISPIISRISAISICLE
uniref:Transmembrane protein n=1 Tax=Parastrongyloides trichosuri TaxID=131310 RepID=A0A0N5A1E5_PARTI